jgi:hypothetical protein
MEVVDDRIARRAQELYDKRMAPTRAEGQRALAARLKPGERVHLDQTFRDDGRRRRRRRRAR